MIIEIDTESLVNRISKIKNLNNDAQDETTSGSQAWHRHETIDDIIHDILTDLGD